MNRTKRPERVEASLLRTPCISRFATATVALCVGMSTYSLGAQETVPQVAAPQPAAAFVFPASSSSLQDVTEESPAASLEAANSLPEAPVPHPQAQNNTAVSHGPGGAAHIAPMHSEYIPAGWTAPHWTAHDKIVAGAQDLYSYENFGAMIVSASYSYVTDGQPNYSPSDAFGKRLGAAAIRETSQSIFSEMIFAPLLHEDPRYYQKGDGHGFLPRTFYAITRPLVTRTDGGRETVNGALLLGYAGAAALTPTYYPEINRNFHDTASTFAGSIGGAALGFFVTEFSDDVLRATHLRRTLK